VTFSKIMIKLITNYWILMKMIFFPRRAVIINLNISNIAKTTVRDVNLQSIHENITSEKIPVPDEI